MVASEACIKTCVSYWGSLSKNTDKQSFVKQTGHSGKEKLRKDFLG